MEDLIAKLREEGVVFKPGLSNEQLHDLENRISGELPSDLKSFLGYGVPTEYLNQPTLRFPDWYGDVGGTLKGAQLFIDHCFELDVDDGYWNDLFGDKPADLSAAKSQALHFIHQLPTLIPIYGHRFMIATVQSPVISFQGPVDTIIYGDNLHDYFVKEFSLDIENDSKALLRDLGDWSAILAI